MTLVKFSDVVTINPKEKLPRGSLAHKVAMEDIQPFTKFIPSYTISKYNGGTKFRNNDTLFARITPSLENGKTSLVTNLPKNSIGFGSTEFLVFRAMDGLLPAYLYYLVTTDTFREMAIKSMTGTSGRQRVQTDVVANYVFDLPSIEKQQIIVSKLNPLDHKINLNGKINDNLLELGSTLWDKYFQFANADKQQSRLTDLADIVAGGTPSKKNESFYDGGTIPWITPKDLSNASGTVFINHGDVSITEAGLSGSSAKLMPAGSVLFSSRAPIGYVAIANNPVTTNQGFKSLVPHDDSETYYLYYLLKKLTPHIESVAGGSTFKEISGSGMKSIEFPKPDDVSMSEFATLVQPMFNLIRENEEEIQRLIELRDVLLSNLLG